MEHVVGRVIFRDSDSIADVHDRRDLGNHDVASEVDAGGLERPLSTQVVGNDAVSAAPLLEEAGSLLIPSLPLPHLLALFLTAKSSPARRLSGLAARGSRGDGASCGAAGDECSNLDSSAAGD